MVITNQQIKFAEKFFKNQPESVLGKTAAQMNQTHPIIPQVMIALENSGASGYDVDEIMLKILTVWFIYEKIQDKQIKPIEESDFEKNMKTLMSFIKYFNGEIQTGGKDIYKMKYLKDNTLERYAFDFLHQYYEGIENIPSECFYPFFAMLKCLEDNVFEDIDSEGKKPKRTVGKKRKNRKK